jgi:membrane-bound metal-dependent hydrolase YbcI (DUF457 family)
VYVGHAALALLARSKRPRLAIALLIPVAFAPDWLKWIFEEAGHANREISHSLVSVGLGATVVALCYYLWSRAPGDSLTLWLVYLSHWPADFITGIKPTWPGGPNVGLLLYAHPIADIVLESVLVVVCWLVYRRSLPVLSRQRVMGFLIPLGLVGMQIVFEAIQSPDLG